MSRKNNKSIKRRYNQYLKSQERREEHKKQEREKHRELKREEEEAEDLLDAMGIEDEKPERMDVEKNKKIKKKRLAKAKEGKGGGRRRMK